MCLVCKAAYGATALSVVVGGSQGAILKNSTKELTAKVQKLENLDQALSKVSPAIETPKWFSDQIEAERLANRSQMGQRVVYYTVSTKGDTSSDFAEFAAQANQTLNDPRGWARLGVRFEQASSGGSFNLILSEASLVPTFSSGCDAVWSCRVGSSVIINDNRWSQASDSWNAAGGNLRDYRHMVINHEVGHWLGHGHYNCKTSGAKANVMQQQSIDLQGCAFNPWPLDEELSSTQLGIDKRR